jgi:hypothetical protein
MGTKREIWRVRKDGIEVFQAATAEKALIGFGVIEKKEDWETLELISPDGHWAKKLWFPDRSNRRISPSPPMRGDCLFSRSGILCGVNGSDRSVQQSANQPKISLKKGVCL